MSKTKKVRDDRFIIESLFLGDECRCVPRPRRARSKISAPVNLQNSLINLKREENIEWKIFLNNKMYLLLLLPIAQRYKIERLRAGQCLLAERVKKITDDDCDLWNFIFRFSFIVQEALIHLKRENLLFFFHFRFS